jgi:hypothetical protein
MQHIIQMDANAATYQNMYLQELIMSVDGHVPPEEIGQLFERLIVDVRVSVTLVVNLPYIDIWYRRKTHPVPP